MTTTLSSKGQIVLPAKLRKRLALTAGDSLEVAFENVKGSERIVITRKKLARPKMKMVKDPLTGWPVLQGAPGAPKLTGERVKEMLADFP